MKYIITIIFLLNTMFIFSQGSIVKDAVKKGRNKDNTFSVNNIEKKMIEKDKLLKWFNKNPEYILLDYNTIFYEETGFSYTVVNQFKFIDLETSNKIKLEEDEKRRKEEEWRLAEEKRIEDAKIITGNYNGYYYNYALNPEIKLAYDKVFSEFGNRKYFKVNIIYDGQMTNGIPNGKGKVVISTTEYGFWEQINNKLTYDGYWVNGEFDGYGKLEDYTKGFYFEYNGNFKQNKFHGDGKLQFFYGKDFGGNEHNCLSIGNFSNGQKNGEFEEVCQFKVTDFGYKSVVKYDNGNVLNSTSIYNQLDEYLDYLSKKRMKQQQDYQNYKNEKCSNCEVNYDESTYPKVEDNFLWPGTSERDGEVVMKNGDKYKFNYKSGKCRVLNGIFSSDDYYSNFKIMIENLQKKCIEKYCN